MSSSVDSRVLAMKIDNAQFEKGVSTSIASMGKLKEAMSFSGNTDLNSAVGNFNLNPLTGAIEGVSKAWLAMTTVALTALANITNRAVDAGIQLGKSLTVTPITSGLAEYQTNLNSIQTILANTSVSGATLDDVNKALTDLNKYSDKTIYNFSEMARNIGTFTAAGVDLDTSVNSIKGIAQLAALSGSSSLQASTAMYQLSQAIAAGKVQAADWNSVVSAGMGGSIFQRALAETAVAMGKIDENALSLEGKMKNVVVNGQSFKNSIMAAPGQESWLTSDVLTNTLQQFTGDLSKAELAAQGFNDAQIKAIQKQAKMASDAAQDVKTLQQVIDVARETAGSGWAHTWQLIFGDFNQAKTTFTNLSNTINGFINANAQARNKVLKAWNDIGNGGRRVLINGLKNAFEALMSVVKPIYEAFRDIFPPTTGRQLYQMTQAFRKFTKGLILSEDAQENLHTIFKALFSVIGLGVDVVKGFLGYIFDLGGLVDGGAGSILGLVASVADLVLALTTWIDKGQFIEKFFDHLSAARARVLTPLIALIGRVADAFSALIEKGPDAFFRKLGDAGTFLSDVFDRLKEGAENVYDAVSEFLSGLGLSGIFDFGTAAEDATDNVNVLAASVAPLGSSGDSVSAAWQRVKDVLSDIWDVAKAIGGAIGDAFQAIKDKFANADVDLGIDDALAVINTGFFIAFYAMLRSFIKSLKSITDPLGGVAESFRGVIDQVTSNLKTMQTSLKADILVKIATSIALLAGSIFLLSRIDGKGLTVALGAVSVLVGEMAAAMVFLIKSTTGLGLVSTARVIGMGNAMVSLSVAMVVLAGAVAVFGLLDGKVLAKGLGAVATTLTLLTAAVAILSKTGGAAAIVGVAFALGVLAISLDIMAGTLKLYEQLDFSTILEGVGKIAFAIIAIGISMGAMNYTGILSTAFAMGVLSIALNLMAGAFKLMASLSLGDTIQTLVLLGGALAILVGSLVALEFTGAAAAIPLLALLAASMVPFAMAFKMLGSISWKGVGVGLTILAGALTLLGVAAGIFLYTGIIVALPILAASLALMGAGLMLSGAGLFLFAAGLASLAVSGAAGFAVLIGGVVSFLEILPLLAQQFGLFLKALAVTLGDAAPELAKAITKLGIASFLALQELIPVWFETLTQFLITGLEAFMEVTPYFVEAGYTLLLALLRGFDKHIGEIADVAVDIIVKFTEKIGKQSQKLADAAFQMIIDFIEGLAAAIRDDENSEKLGAAGFDLGLAIAEGMKNGMEGAAKEVAKQGFTLGLGPLGSLGVAIDAHSPSRETYKIGGYFSQGFANGITNSSHLAYDAARKMRDNTLSILVQGIKDAYNEGAEGSNPKVTPVLDLDKFRKDAKDAMDEITNGSPQLGGGSSRIASDIASQKGSADYANDGQRVHVKNEYNFKQEINSPKNVDSVDAYRGTKSLLKLFEGRVGS